MPFRFNLPFNIPTSFEHLYGHTRYSVDSILDIPWSFDKTSSQVFTVISTVDLNLMPNLRVPYGMSGEKMICCGPCKQGPITANFSISKSGFVPGELIQFKSMVENNTKRKTKRMTIKLFQTIKFHATTKTKTSGSNVVFLNCDKQLGTHASEEWNNSFMVPVVCPSSNGLCKIIEIGYVLVFNFDATGTSTSTDLMIPITLGTIPLIDEQNQQV